jgi:hypothetical protein
MISKARSVDSALPDQAQRVDQTARLSDHMIVLRARSPARCVAGFGRDFRSVATDWEAVADCRFGVARTQSGSHEQADAVGRDG